MASHKLTWYGAHPKRGAPAMEAHGILLKRTGVLVHDCWPPYWRMPGEHALCNAHLIRELVFVHESTGQPWAQRMIRHLCRARDHCETARAGRKEALPEPLRRRIERRYEATLAQARACHPAQVRTNPQRGRVKQSVAFNLVNRLTQHAGAVLRFVSDLAAPFTNNLGERAIRMPKVKQKISGSFRTLKGAQDFCAIRSYLDTAIKQGHNRFEALRCAFNDNPMSFAAH